MVDLAVEAFSTNNFDLAAEIYERSIRQKGPNSCLYMGLGDAYARGGHLKESLDAYRLAFRLGNILSHQLENLVESLLTMVGDSSDFLEKIKRSRDVLFYCDICKSLWRDPVTLACGHTFCRKCINKETVSNCKTCHFTWQNNLSSIRTNVIIGNCIGKWFPEEMKASDLKDRGNKLFKDMHYGEAITAYSEACDLVPEDHLSVSNRSFTYATIHCYKDALRDAQKAIGLRPDWPKGYYRLGTALSGLEQHEEAVFTFLKCLILDPTIIPAKTALQESLHKVLSCLQPQDLKQSQKHPSLVPAHKHLVKGMLESSPLPTEAGSLWSQATKELPDSGIISEHSIMQLKQSLLSHIFTASMFSLPEKCSPHQSQVQEKTHSAPETPNSTPVMNLRRHLSDTHLSEHHHTSPHHEPIPTSSHQRYPSINTSPPKLQPRRLDERRYVPSELLDAADFECTLCYRLFYQPVTTPCGHVFCKQCLERSLDHSSSCPLCKTSLIQFLTERILTTTQVIEQIIQTYFPEEASRRKAQYNAEISELARMGQDPQHEIPVFVCTLAFPRIPCMLHVFEPRYRLMVRQCMEAGTRQFGMCACLTDDESSFSDYGTMLEIQEVQYFTDGRSVVTTVGGRRFKVISRGTKDGYRTAKVEFLRDQVVPDESKPELLTMLNQVYDEAQTWFGTISQERRSRILQHSGPIPDKEPNPFEHVNGPAWCWWLVSVLPLDRRAQHTLLSMTSIRERLNAIIRVLAYVRRTDITAM